MIREAYSNELYHHGIKGQKWGVRRFQNEDGSVTPAGAERYYEGNGTSNTSKKKGLSDGQKKAIKVGAAVVGTAAVAYGGYKLSKVIKNKAYAKSLEAGKKELNSFLSKNSSKEFLEQPLHKLLYDRASFEGSQEILDKARSDSRTLGNSIKTLTGRNGMSTAGLKSMGIKTIDVSKSDRALSGLSDAFGLHESAKADAERIAKLKKAASRTTSKANFLTLTPNSGGSGVSNADILKNLQSAVNSSNEQLRRAKSKW